MTLSSDALVAGGLLENVGELSEHLTVDAAAEQLRAILSPSALWESGPITPDDVATVESRLHAAMPRWTRPTEISDHLQQVLDDAWNVVVDDGRPSWGAPSVRVVVDDAADADALHAAGPVGARIVVPSLETRAERFSWHWPMHITVAPGPRADAWRTQLQQGEYAHLYIVEDVAADGSVPRADILFIDADNPPAAADATCVMMLRDGGSAGELAASGRGAFRAAVAIGVPDDDLGWFSGVVREMAHDQPIDVAMAIAVPDARVIADPKLVNATAARQWALAVSDELEFDEQQTGRGVDSARTQFRTIALSTPFDAELRGATDVSGFARDLGNSGIDAGLDLRLATAAVRAEPPPPTPPRAQRPKARRIVADAYIGEQRQKTALAPDTDHMLVVKIAVPGKGETSSDVDFDERELPKDAIVDLTVLATSDALGLRERRPIKLLTTDRAAPSTPAAFPFRSPADGEIVDIALLVEFQGRPLQEAHYLAPVRAQPVPGDAIQVRNVPLSSSPEPRAEATPAQASLAVNGANLERTDGADRRFDMGLIAPIVNAIEQTASASLGVDGVSPADPEVRRKLLVDLARIGKQLGDLLKPLQLGTATTISILVDPESPVVPLELVYEAKTAPRENAKVCPDHPIPRRASAPKVPCTKAGARFVCPTAFWGQTRVVAREVRDSKPRDDATLTLRPVLYAAATRADEDLQPNERKPSELLADSIAALVGADALARATSWTQWRQVIRARNPELLVVLGHTDHAGTDTTLEIGGRSHLASADFTSNVVFTGHGPPPLVVLMACQSAVPGDPFGTIAGEFVASGAAAVVATLTKLHGPDGASAAAEVVRAIVKRSGSKPKKLGATLTEARRQLVARGNLLGLLLVSHGEIDLVLADG